VQIVIATILGIVIGMVFRESAQHLKVIGDIFLRLVQMSIVVLIMGAVIEAIGRLKPAELGKIGIKLLFWFLGTTILAAGIGCVLGLVFLPGTGVSMAATESVNAVVQTSFSQMILELIPTNIVTAMSEGNMIQIIVFAILFGIGLGTWQAKSKRESSSLILKGLEEVNGVIVEMIRKIMRVAPLGIGALIAVTTGNIGIAILIPLLKFLSLMAVGSLIHLFICLTITAVHCRTSILNILKRISNISLVAFTTASSAVSLPVTMHDSHHKLGVSKRMVDLVVPLGMTLNSNGLALFLALSVITIAQIFGIEMSLVFILKVVALACLACLGTIVVPGGGIVALTIVVPTLGLPLESVAILAGIDWFSGMFRTLLNVNLDAVVAMNIAQSVGEIDRSILDPKK
jgi:Na+/H+-dicarboxylate symporter